MIYSFFLLNFQYEGCIISQEHWGVWSMKTVNAVSIVLLILSGTLVCGGGLWLQTFQTSQQNKMLMVTLFFRLLCLQTEYCLQEEDLGWRLQYLPLLDICLCAAACVSLQMGTLPVVETEISGEQYSFALDIVQ